jgi:hypothetical protein
MVVSLRRIRAGQEMPLKLWHLRTAVLNYRVAPHHDQEELRRNMKLVVRHTIAIVQAHQLAPRDFGAVAIYASCAALPPQDTYNKQLDITYIRM